MSLALRVVGLALIRPPDAAALALSQAADRRSSDALATSATAAAAATEAAASAASALAQASLAVDAAAAAGNLYPTTAAGLAATSNGDYFLVPSGTDQGSLIVYLNSSGSAVEFTSYPSSSSVRALQRGTVPETGGSASDLLYVVDALGRVAARIDADGGHHIPGWDSSIQERIGSLAKRADGDGSLWSVLDSLGRVVEYTGSAGDKWLSGMSRSVQRTLAVGVSKPRVSLPAGFTPFGTTYVGEERYIWSGMPRELRASESTLTCYPFRWDADPVGPTEIKRRQSSLGSTNWSTADLNITDPGGYFPGKQFRDVSFLYDRARAKYFAVVNSIASQVGGYVSDSFSVWSSTDGLAWSFVTYVVAPNSPSHVWSPEFFIDDDGTVYVIVSVAEAVIAGQPTSLGRFSYRIFRCDTPDTMLSWTYIGRCEGTKLPKSWEGDQYYNCIDPFMFKRDGVYYIIAQSQNVGKAAAFPYAVLCWAAGSSITGPFDHGAFFVPTTGTQVYGEGMSVIEMPAGSAYRWRIYFDDVLNAYTGQMVYAESNDLTHWTNPADAGMGDLSSDYRHHASVVLGL